MFKDSVLRVELQKMKLPKNCSRLKLLPAIGLYIPARPVRRGLGVPFLGTFLGKQKGTKPIFYKNSLYYPIFQ